MSAYWRCRSLREDPDERRVDGIPTEPQDHATLPLYLRAALGRQVRADIGTKEHAGVIWLIIDRADPKGRFALLLNGRRTRNRSPIRHLSSNYESHANNLDVLDQAHGFG